MTLTLFIIFFVFLAMGIPVAFSIGLSSLFCTVFFQNSLPLNFLISKFYAGIDVFVFLAIPFFVLAGQLMNEGGLTKYIIDFSSKLVGHLRGGLAHVNILASMLFAGVSGSCIADSSGIGSILIPPMLKHGYDKDFAIAVTASSSTIGPIIPPSIQMVIYSSYAGVSIGRMFLGGTLPGVLIGFSLMVLSYIICLKRGYDEKSKRATFKEIVNSFKKSILVLFIPIILIGGIISGVFTATEAGCAAVVYALFISLVVLKSIKFRNLVNILVDSAVTTATVLIIIGFANIFGQLLVRDLFQIKIYNFFSLFFSSPYIFIFMVLLFLLVMGCFIDGSVLIILFAQPLSSIAITKFGFDPIQFGVVFVMISLIGAITPPVGTLLFVNCSIAKTDLMEASHLILPFVLVLFAVCLLCAYIPFLVTYIPNVLMP